METCTQWGLRLDETYSLALSGRPLWTLNGIL